MSLILKNLNLSCNSFYWLLLIFCFLPKYGISQLKEKIAHIEAIDNENVNTLIEVSFPINITKTHKLYLYPEWSTGWLRLKSKKDLIPAMTRFNILTGTVELMCRKSIRTLKADRVEMVKIGTHLFVPNELSPSNYFEVLSVGKLNLLRAYQLNFTYEGSSNTLTSVVTGEKRSTAKFAYYCSKKGAPVQPFKTKKKKILELMEGDEKVKQFIDSEKLKFSAMEDLRKLFDFYNGNG